LTTITLVPKNSRKCPVSVVAAPTRRDARFWMSRANASKSGMGMMPGAYWLKSSSSDALLADTDIICGGGGGGGGEL
jgi:hypothetical protein